MKALRFHAPGDVRIEDVPEPECGPAEIKIKVKNCSTCGTDVKIRVNGHPNLTGVTTMGHEVAGEIVEIGEDAVGDVSVGDRVQVIAAVPCGPRSGRTRRCRAPHRGRGASGPMQGALP